MSESAGIVLEATLPLTWESNAFISHANKEMQRQGNIALLRALASIEAIAPERELETESTQKALERVESKLDIVMLLLARMAGANGLLPAEKPVTLRLANICWLEHEPPPTVGQSILIGLYLNPRLPQPLLLPAQVINLQEKNEKTQIEAIIEDTGEELNEWLTRTIFRYHRRQVQASRQP